MKKVGWSVIGHKRGQKHNMRLGSIQHRGGLTKTEAMKYARKDFKQYTVTNVK